MPVAGDINITVTEPDPLGDAAYAWVYGGSPEDPDENPADGVWSLIGSIPLNDTTLIDQLDFGAHTHICCRACNVAAPVVSGFTPNYGPFTDWVELPTAPAAAWEDDFEAANNTLISALTPAAGGAYSATAKGGSAVARIEGNQVRPADHNDSWFTVAEGTTGLITRLRVLIRNDAASTSFNSGPIILANENTNGVDAVGASIQYLNGGWQIVSYADGVRSTLASGSAGYTGLSGDPFWLEIDYRIEGSDHILRSRIYDAVTLEVLGTIEHTLAGDPGSGDAGIWMTDANARFDAVRGYAE